MEEKWKTIKGYEDCYLISSFGRVMSLKRQGVSDTHILSQKINNKGYAYCELWKEGKGKTFLIHRLVAMHFLNNPKDFSCDVNHKDENPLNNNVKISSGVLICITLDTQVHCTHEEKESRNTTTQLSKLMQMGML